MLGGHLIQKQSISASPSFGNTILSDLNVGKVLSKATFLNFCPPSYHTTWSTYWKHHQFLPDWDVSTTQQTPVRGSGWMKELFQAHKKCTLELRPPSRASYYCCCIALLPRVWACYCQTPPQVSLMIWVALVEKHCSKAISEQNKFIIQNYRRYTNRFPAKMDWQQIQEANRKYFHCWWRSIMETGWIL